MKNGAVYAARIRVGFQRLAKSIPPEDPDGTLDPLRQAAIAILGRHDGPAAGQHALQKIFRRVLDWNELRVSTPEELAAMVGGTVRHALDVCNDMCRMLNGIFKRENAMNLDRLLTGKVKDARKYLETLPGMDAYSTACVMLWSLGAHAIPVHDRLLAALRREEWVDPQASREEVQSFLERHVKASLGRRFCQVMNAHAERSSSTGRRPAGRAPASPRKSRSRATPSSRLRAGARRKAGK